MKKILFTILCAGLLTLPVKSKADTINHIAVNANLYNVQSFAGSFDWDVDTQAPIAQSANLVAIGPVSGSFDYFATIWTNFAAWGDGLGHSFQIDIRQFRGGGNLTTFNDIGTYNATHGEGALEFYGAVPELAGAAFGAWNGMTGTMVISTPEPTTIAMLIMGLVSLFFVFKPRTRH